VQTVVFVNENEQNTREITADGNPYVNDYEGDFSTDLSPRFPPLLQVKGVKFLGKYKGLVFLF
jgi:hypothetical protein